MPGEQRLVYIAGHRTTYLAPFSHIDAIRPGDAIRLELRTRRSPTGRRTTASSQRATFRSCARRGTKSSSCKRAIRGSSRPTATIVYAALVSVTPRGGTPYAVSAVAAGR